MATTTRRVQSTTAKPAALKDKPTGMSISIELVTPETASKLLRKNTDNRKLNDGYVNRYVNDMRAGRWTLSNNGIGLSKSNQLLDGQHRLRAVEMSGIAQRFIVVRGLPDIAKDTADTGKTRTFADVLTINGFAAKLAQPLSSAASWCARYERDALTTNNKLAGNLSHPELLAWLDDNLDLIPVVEWVQSLDVPSRKGISKTMLTGLIFEAKGLEGEAMEFVEAYSTGIGLQEGEPALMLSRLVDKLHSNPNRKASRIYYMGVLIKAFNHHVRGNSIGHLRFVYDGNNRKKLKNREQFPKILTADTL